MFNKIRNSWERFGLQEENKYYTKQIKKYVPHVFIENNVEYDKTITVINDYQKKLVKNIVRLEELKSC